MTEKAQITHGQDETTITVHHLDHIIINFDSVYIQDGGDCYNFILKGQETCRIFGYSLSEESKKYLEKHKHPKSY